MFNKNAFKIKLQTKLKQFTALALSTALVLTSISITSPLTVHAESNSATGDNGQLSELKGNIKTFPLGFNDIHQFYRFYMIDNQHNVVSKVVDFVYSDPRDCGVKAQNWYTNPRWAPLSTDRSNYDWYMISEIMNTYCAGADTPPYDITDDETMVPVKISSQEYVGAKLQLWFLGLEGRSADSIGNTRPSGSTGNTGNTGGTGGTTIPPINSNNNEEVPLTEESGFTQDQITKIGENIHNGEMILQKDHNWAITIIKEFNDKRNCSIITEYSGQINKEYNAVYVASSNDLHWSDSKSKANATGAAYREAVQFGVPYDVAKALAYLASESKLQTASLPLTSAEDLLYTNIPLSSSKSADSTPLTLESTYSGTNGLAELEKAGIDIEKLSELLDIQVPLAEAEKTLYNFPADRFFSKESTPENPNPFAVKGFNQDLSGNGSVTLLDALKYKENGKYKYGLIIEGGMWSGLYKDSTHYENWYTYGSYTNILQYYLSKGWTGAGCHYSYMKAHGKNCLVVSKNVDDFGLKEAKNGGYMDLDKIMEAIEDGVGYGMHFYYAGDLEPSNDTSSDTSTYDEPLGSQIGPSEDCSSFDEETSYSTLSKKVTIVKNYVTRDSSTGVETVDGNFLRKDVPHNIDIEDEPQYIVEKWETSTSQTIPTFTNGDTTQTYQQLTQNSSHTQSETANGFLTGTVTLDKTEFILYVKLVRDNTTPPPPMPLSGDYILHESEIARSVSSAGGSDSKQIPISITYSFPNISTTCNGISGHDYNWKDGYYDTNGDWVAGHYEDHCTGASHSAGSVTDSKVTVIAKNENESTDDSKKVIVQSGVDKFKSIMTTVTLDRGTTETATSKDGSHTYYFTIYRHINGEDTLKLAKYNQKQSSSEDTDKNTTETVKAGNAAIVSTLGYGEENNKTSKTRASAGYTQSVSFKFKFDDTNSSDKSTTYTIGSINCGHSTCGPHYGTGNVTSTTEVSETADIAVQVYSGSANKALHTTVTPVRTGPYGEKLLPLTYSGYNKSAGRMIQEQNTIKFNPFIRMTFSLASELKDGTKKKYGVNVLSEYQRQLLPNAYAEVLWNYNENENPISLKSQMWATDEILSNGTSWRQSNQVLKGGSSAAINIDDADMREVVLKTYQVVFPDEEITGSNAFISNATEYSVANATTEHEKFLNSCIDGFENLHIVQRISTRIQTSGNIADENKVERGGDISFLNNNSNTASMDSKYYLSKDPSNGLNSGANEGDLDVKLIGTTQKYYKIWSDISGNILIASGTDISSLKNNINGTVILTKNQGIADLTNQTALMLNERTLAVEKLLNAVERNTGNDSTADWSIDGHWYNESFALYILESTSTVKLGLKNTATRSFVLDPRLIPYLSSKSEQGTTAFTSEFTVDNYSELYGASKAGKIGEFKGVEIYMRDMNKILKSKLFYIPNMTVQGSR